MSRLRDDQECRRYFKGTDAEITAQLDAIEKDMRRDLSIRVSKHDHVTQELADDPTRERAASLEKVMQNLDVMIARAIAPDIADWYNTSDRTRELASKVANEYMRLTKINREQGTVRGGDVQIDHFTDWAKSTLTQSQRDRIVSLIK